MNFYHNLVTEKSWQLLQSLRKKYDFILIGGWAVFLYAKALKSKDIDLVLEFSGLEKLKEEFAVAKNERLKKYEARREGMEIDIYIPFYSHLGLPVEDLRKFAVGLEGFQTVEKEILAVLKQVALTGRKETVKGRKDLVDLVCLFRLPNFNWEKYQKVISKYGLAKSSATVVETLKRTTKMDELGLNVHQMAGLKRKLPLLTPPRKFI
jgi:hypothetical protein